ncbi:exonuclease V-like [Babylonia areolata]|uniref:exonuclease V-like n=1 Tax=Babylonia areolata TaxID=304850 RepID=UPI003FD17D8C
MSEERRALQNGEEKEDDCWSDIDESLLARCDQLENDELENTTENYVFKPEVGVSIPDVRREGDQRCEVSQILAGHSSSADVCDADAGVVKVIRGSELGEITPMQLFNKGGYLCVTDLTQQLWCEHHLCYTLMGVVPPEPPPPSLTDASLPLPLLTADRPEVKAGKSAHLARELEIHDVVSVSITSKGDKWGLHVLNLLTTLHSFLAGSTVAREVPIFGDPFGKGDLVFGIIDELRFDPEAYHVTLTELKTRKGERLPGKSQKQQHRLQVLMYKQLWDNLVTGNFSSELFLSKLSLSASSSQQPLGKDLLRHVKAAGVSATTLSDLLSLLLSTAQVLVCISSLEIEYISQDTGSVIGRFAVQEESGDWLERTFTHCMGFWQGHREAEGVDVEEAWKCGGCEYSMVCEWRIQKTRLLALKNQQQRLAKTSTVRMDR